MRACKHGTAVKSNPRKKTPKADKTPNKKLGGRFAKQNARQRTNRHVWRREGVWGRQVASSQKRLNTLKETQQTTISPPRGRRSAIMFGLGKCGMVLSRDKEISLKNAKSSVRKIEMLPRNMANF